MTTTPGQATAAEMYRATAIARHRAEALIAGTALKIREHARELVIFNPADPEKGEIHIAYDTGYASWVRPAWTYLGYVAGYHDPEDPARKPVDAQQIITALTTDPP